MPKKNRRHPRQRRRPRSRSPVCLLDLSDELLLKILRNLGLKEVLTPLTIRKTAPAFFLALTCKRLYRIFLQYITDIDLGQDHDFPPPLYHPTHSDSHVRWLVSNLPNLRLLDLAEDRAHILSSLSTTLRLETLKYVGDYNTPSIAFLPSTLRVLHMGRATQASMDCLASLHESPDTCHLRSVFISCLRVAHVKQLLTFYTRSCTQVDYFYTSFALSRDADQREKDSEDATRCIRFISSTYEEYAPQLETLGFAVTGESRMDLDFDGYDLESLQSQVIDPYRLENTARKSLKLLSCWTDAALLEDWVNSISNAITPFVSITIETGHNCMLYVPPLIGFSEPSAMKYRVTTCITAQTTERNQWMPSLRCEITEGQLRYLCVTERFVVEKFFFNSEYRSATLAYLGSTGGIFKISLYFAFGLRAVRAFIWDDDSANVTNNLSILTEPHDETPEEMAYTFLADLLSVSKGVESLSMSFEAVSYAPDNELLVNKILQGLPDATELKMIMPSENCEGHPRDGFLSVTEQFLVGLPFFLQTLMDSCPKLEKLNMVHVGEMNWEHENDRQVLLSSAEEALDHFEQRRPNVYVENVRSMLHFWKS